MPIWFWLIEALLFFFLAMGPSTFRIGSWETHLPYFYIYKYIPFYANIRVVGRLFVFSVLGLSMLSALGIDFFSKKYPRGKHAVVVLLAALIWFDFFIAPLETNSLAYSPFYDKIGKDPGQYKLLEIPGSTNDVFFNYEWITRNAHKKELINGMSVAREIEGQFDFQRNTPVIKQLLYTIPKGNNPEKSLGKKVNPVEYYKNANEILNENNVGYITVSKKFVKEHVLANAQNFIEKYIKYESKYEDEFIVAYKVSVVAPE